MPKRRNPREQRYHAEVIRLLHGEMRDIARAIEFLAELAIKSADKPKLPGD